ncbi:MAG TPA: hypothetical protein VFI11_08300 [Anaerolineales bacterium]|nr:hypothetical protein [Anaerolineales bacterium]
MNEHKRRVFEVDRRMELKLRLLAKRAEDRGPASGMSPLVAELPERDLVARVIERVRRL